MLLVEHTALVGGTTAISGGMVWVPANHLMAEAGRPDSIEAARADLAATVPPGDDAAPLEAFLTRGDETIRFLQAKTALRLRRAARSAASAWHVGKLLARHAFERLQAPRGTTLHLGNALAGWLLKSALDLGVDLRLAVSVQRLLFEGADQGRSVRVLGAEIESSGRREAVRASRGVILASGGLSHAAALRARYVPAQAGTFTTTVNPQAARCGADLALDAGARLSRGSARQGFWVPGSTFTRRDGSAAVFPHTVTDRGKPGLIAVDRLGRRFVNEALSYHEFVQAQLRAGPAAIPAFLVCDRRFLWRYGLGCVRPFALARTLAPLLRCGYLKRAATLAGLADAIGTPAAALEATVSQFNEGARRGVDAQFGRGGDIYQRHLGDADHRPNPCVAQIEAAPFYAVAVQPADLGMAAGLVTDATARVLGADGAPIEGLYACGNDMQSVMKGAYTGPGITLGPALVFGCLAARHAACR